jgi:uncharacterized membrane protein
MITYWPALQFYGTPSEIFGTNDTAVTNGLLEFIVEGSLTELELRV